MQLVIAEKPSVVISIAAVLDATSRKDGYMEGGGYHYPTVSTIQTGRTRTST